MLNNFAPGSPEDARELRQMLERLLHDIGRLQQAAPQRQNDYIGIGLMPQEIRVTPEEPEEP